MVHRSVTARALVIATAIVGVAIAGISLLVATSSDGGPTADAEEHAPLTVATSELVLGGVVVVALFLVLWAVIALTMSSRRNAA